MARPLNGQTMSSSQGLKLQSKVEDMLSILCTAVLTYAAVEISRFNCSDDLCPLAFAMSIVSQLDWTALF